MYSPQNLDAWIVKFFGETEKRIQFAFGKFINGELAEIDNAEYAD